jgi:hypothetical protein
MIWTACCSESSAIDIGPHAKLKLHTPANSITDLIKERQDLTTDSDPVRQHFACPLAIGAQSYIGIDYSAAPNDSSRRLWLASWSPLRTPAAPKAE